MSTRRGPREVAEAIGWRVAANAESALDAADAVLVTATTDAHARLVSMAIDRRLPVFCEKPLALELDETEALVEKIERTGAIVQVGFQRRFDPAYLEARRLVETGALGTIYLVRLIAHDHEPPPDAYIPVSGGLFRDSSIHDFDALRWVTGLEVAELYAAGSVRNFPVFERYDDVDTGAVVLQMTDGTLGGPRSDAPRSARLRHPHGGHRLEGRRDGRPQHGTPLRSLEADAPSMPGPPWTSFLTRFEAAYRAELLAFLRVAWREADSPCTARDGLEAMRISVAATRSRAEHRPIRMSEVA